MMVHSQAEAGRAFAALPRHGRLWFVDYGICNRLDRLGCHEVDAALQARYHVAESHAFFENLVERLVSRSGVGHLVPRAESAREP